MFRYHSVESRNQLNSQVASCYMTTWIYLRFLQYFEMTKLFECFRSFYSGSFYVLFIVRFFHEMFECLKLIVFLLQSVYGVESGSEIQRVGGISQNCQRMNIEMDILLHTELIKT